MHGDRVSPHNAVIRGDVRGHYVSADGIWTPATSWQRNLIMYDWATLVSELMRGAPDGKPYKIGGMYLEFENNGGAAVTPPSYDRSGGKAYYDSLLVSGTRDYLRVPLTAVTLASTDEDLFSRGNKNTFFAQTEGVVGAHGKTFSHTVSSRIFGGALVAFPEFADDSQDLVFSRFYFEAANQLIKLAGSQVGISWPITLQ